MFHICARVPVFSYILILLSFQFPVKDFTLFIKFYVYLFIYYLCTLMSTLPQNTTYAGLDGDQSLANQHKLCFGAGPCCLFQRGINQ